MKKLLTLIGFALLVACSGDDAPTDVAEPEPANNPLAEEQAFMKEAKEKIIAYYNENCDRIIQEANDYSKAKDYRMALITLLSIPSEVTECSDKARAAKLAAYKA